MTRRVFGPALHGPMDGTPMGGDPDVPLYAFPVRLSGGRLSTVTTDRLPEPGDGTDGDPQFVALRDAYCLGVYGWDHGAQRWRWHPTHPIGPMA